MPRKRRLHIWKGTVPHSLGRYLKLKMNFRCPDENNRQVLERGKLAKCQICQSRHAKPQTHTSFPIRSEEKYPSVAVLRHVVNIMQLRKIIATEWGSVNSRSTATQIPSHRDNSVRVFCTTSQYRGTKQAQRVERRRISPFYSTSLWMSSITMELFNFKFIASMKSSSSSFWSKLWHLNQVKRLKAVGI